MLSRGLSVLSAANGRGGCAAEAMTLLLGIFSGGAVAPAWPEGPAVNSPGRLPSGTVNDSVGATGRAFNTSNWPTSFSRAALPLTICVAGGAAVASGDGRPKLLRFRAAVVVDGGATCGALMGKGTERK